MIAATDTSPVLYLVLIGEVDLLADLFTEILIPPAVVAELSNPGTPEAVRSWTRVPPSWVRLVERPDTSAVPAGPRLHASEREVLAVGLQHRPDRVLLDDGAARATATELGLRRMGTLAVLKTAAERGRVDLPGAVRRLSRTNFRASPDLLRRVLG